MESNKNMVHFELIKKYYIFQVSEDNKKVRRVKTKPLPKDSVEARKEAKNRTIYCVCFLVTVYQKAIFSQVLNFRAGTCTCMLLKGVQLYM